MRETYLEIIGVRHCLLEVLSSSLVIKAITTTAVEGRNLGQRWGNRWRKPEHLRKGVIKCFEMTHSRADTDRKYGGIAFCEKSRDWLMGRCRNYANHSMTRYLYQSTWESAPRCPDVQFNLGPNWKTHISRAVWNKQVCPASRLGKFERKLLY